MLRRLGDPVARTIRRSRIFNAYSLTLDHTERKLEYETDIHSRVHPTAHGSWDLVNCRMRALRRVR